MSQVIAKENRQNKDLLILTASAVLITMFLFFIDEGYYDFRWMLDIGNWVVFVIYTGVILMAQLLVYFLMPNRFRGSRKNAASIVIGTTAGLAVLIGVIFSHVN